MNAENFDVAALLRMAHSPVRNYAIPGVTSSLIGAPSPAGTLRLFQCSRDHQESITPHSHRFDFQCWVLAGSVRNRVWKMGPGDAFMRSIQTFGGEFGAYKVEPEGIRHYVYDDTVYQAGECYAMRSYEIHSIFFSRGAVVLFFEGPTTTDTSAILEPWVDGKTIPTMEVKPWMFERA